MRSAATPSTTTTEPAAAGVAPRGARPGRPPRRPRPDWVPPLGATGTAGAPVRRGHYRLGVGLALLFIGMLLGQPALRPLVGGRVSAGPMDPPADKKTPAVKAKVSEPPAISEKPPRDRGAPPPETDPLLSLDLTLPDPPAPKAAPKAEPKPAPPVPTLILPDDPGVMVPLPEPEALRRIIPPPPPLPQPARPAQPPQPAKVPPAPKAADALPLATPKVTLSPVPVPAPTPAPVVEIVPAPPTIREPEPPRVPQTASRNTPMTRNWSHYGLKTVLAAALAGGIVTAAPTAQAQDKQPEADGVGPKAIMPKIDASAAAKLREEIDALNTTLAQLNGTLKKVGEAQTKTTSSVEQLQTDVSLMRTQMSAMNAELEALRAKLKQQPVPETKAYASPNAEGNANPAPPVPPVGNKGKVKLMNDFLEEVTVQVNGDGYRLIPGQSMTINVPAGSFNYLVNRHQGNTQTRTVQAGETYTIRIHPQGQ